MALRLIRARPGETRLHCHRLRRDACASRDETPAIGASGPHDFTVRCGTFVSCTAAATASHRAFVTCARPSYRVGRADHTVSCPSDKAKYFYVKGLRRRATQMYGAISIPFVIPGHARHEPGIH